MPIALKRFNKKAAFLLIFVTLAAFFIFPLLVFAQASLGIEAGAATGLGSRDLKEIIASVVRIILGFLGIIAVIIIIYGGYTWMTAAGNEDKISNAKRILVNAVIGLVIILAAFGIVSYVIARLQEATQPPGEEPGRGRGGFEGGLGVLGGGILSSVYPEPGANDVPRNTLIMVTFKEEMDAGTVIEADNPPAACQNFPEGTICGYLKASANNPTVRIINRSKDNQVLGAEEVVAVTADNRNFVFDPVQYLGSADGTTDYSINLTDQIDKKSGAPAFLIGGYTWSFQVSSILDLTPPQLESVIPVSPPSVPKNTIIQLNFNEAINVMTATGQATGNPEQGLKTILISYEDDQGNLHYVTGQATISNRFRTIEFVSDLACEVNGQAVEENSCGVRPTCFPGNEEITTLIKAATVDQGGNTIDIFSGITDAAANSFDGNNNGSSQGQPTDNYSSAFITTDAVDLTPPEIISIAPEQGLKTVPKNSAIKAQFNEQLRSATLNSENFSVFKFACNGPSLPQNLSCYPEGGFSIYKEDRDNQTAAILKTYYPYLNPLTVYNPRLTAGIQDLYQNCFKPAVGPCAAGQVSPGCLEYLPPAI